MINLEHLELLRSGGLRASSLEAPGLYDTNLNTLSIQTPIPGPGQELLGHIKKEWQVKIMAVFFFIPHKKGFKFHAQPQTGAYSCYIV